MQGERFDLIVGVGLYVCTPMLAAKLDLPTVNIIPNGVLPYSLMNLPWPGSGCETQMPVRLSYVTEIGVHSSHPMVRADLVLHSKKSHKCNFRCSFVC